MQFLTKPAVRPPDDAFAGFVPRIPILREGAVGRRFGAAESEIGEGRQPLGFIGSVGAGVGVGLADRYTWPATSG